MSKKNIYHISFFDKILEPQNYIEFDPLFEVMKGESEADMKLITRILKYVAEGDKFNNYNDFCKQLRLPVLEGDSKKYQMKKIKRFMNLKFTGHKIEILKINAKDILALKHKDELRKQIAHWIINKLKGKNQIVISKSQLYSLLELYNSGYQEFKSNKKELFKTLSKDDYWNIFDFYNTTDTFINLLVKRTLSMLQDDEIISYNEKHYVKCFGNISQATKLQKSAIELAEDEVLSQLGYASKVHMIANDDLEEFTRLVKIKLRFTIHKTFEYYYIGYEINAKKQYNQIRKIYKDIDIYEKNGYTINDLMVAKLKENLHIRYEQSENDVYDLCADQFNKQLTKYQYDKIWNRSNSSYYNTILCLIDRLILIKKKFELKSTNN